MPCGDSAKPPGTPLRRAIILPISHPHVGLPLAPPPNYKESRSLTLLIICHPRQGGGSALLPPPPPPLPRLLLSSLLNALKK